MHTIGHGTRSTAELVTLLRGARIDLVVDVRRHPRSRRHPHFARESLERDLPDAGIVYDWRGEELGGRRRQTESSRHIAWRNEGFRGYADHMDGDDFARALERLESDARGRSVAVMCSETLWWRCHRRLISDALVLHGFEVVHIVDAATLQDHKSVPSMRRDDLDRPVYDLGVTSPLPLRRLRT